MESTVSVSDNFCFFSCKYTINKFKTCFFPKHNLLVPYSGTMDGTILNLCSRYYFLALAVLSGEKVGERREDKVLLENRFVP